MAERRLILGIESSCDETAAAVVADGVAVLSNVIASQHDLHAEYRGVVPEIASRAHAERILPVVRRAVEAAGIGLADVSAVAVGNRPGLIGSLLVGVSAAKALAWSLGVPLVGVDHIRAHLYAGLLDCEDEPSGTDAYPALGLVVSGGHTSLFWCESPVEAKVIGRTIDDAIGEAYDKVATILDVPYPGGPNLDRLAQHGNPRAHDLPISRLSPESLDFSFSGLKTAVLYVVQGVPDSGRRKDALPERAGIDLNDEAARADVAASFQRAAVGAVVLKVERALERFGGAAAGDGVRTLLVGGGVSANSLLRTELSRIGRERGIDVRLPRMNLCLDNAAMIAGLGYHLLEAKGWAGDALSLSASPSSR